MLFRAALACSIVLCCAATALAQDAIEYTVSIPHPEQRWLQVEARFPAQAGAPLDVRMARSSPGRYATHEFGKNVYMFEARAEDDAQLPVETVAPAHWRIVAPGSTVQVTYRLFADRVDGTYAAVDGTHAHLNAPAVFAWAPALTDTPIRVTYVQPPGRTWAVATQLFPTADPLTFTAPNLQYFLDAPVEFSAHATRAFTAQGPAGPAAHIRMAVHHLGTDAQLDGFARQVEAIVGEQASVFGELPQFDGGTYTFLLDYLPWADGDGMEHRNSTVCTSSASLGDAATRLAGTVAHEFFHVWNVERIRPASLEPFDFTRANMSGDLWLAEGFTTYYGTLTLIRAGILGQDAGVAQMGAYVNAALRSPGTRFRSAVDMSRLAPYVDAASSIDRTNWENTYASYYPYGAAIALALDLTLRERSGGTVTLDHFMRALWKAHGAPASKAAGYVARPYTMVDVEAALAESSGDATFATDFIARHVTGTEPLPLPRLLATAGYEVREVGGPYLGTLMLQLTDGRVVVAGNTIATSEVYRVGVGRGDTIVSLNGVPITRAGDWQTAVAALTVGQEVELVFESRGERKSARVRAGSDPRLTVVRPPQRTAPQDAVRSAWLSPLTPRS